MQKYGGYKWNRILYIDASQPVYKRVEDLLSRMTIDEKIAQLGSLWVYELLDGVVISIEKAWKLMYEGIGQITRIGGASIIDNSNHESTDPESSAGYGYQIWKCTPEGVYRADGLYGQFCIVIPDKDAVITFTAHEEKAAKDILRAVYDDILPEI